MTEADIPAVLALIAKAYGGTNTTATEAYWRWKHLDNPFGVSPALVAEAGGKLVGVRVFMRWTFWSRDQEVRAVRAVDTAVHPDWQGQGIFSELTRELLDQCEREGIAFVYNTPNHKSRPGYLKLGWEDVGRIPVWVRLRRPLRLIAGGRPTTDRTEVGNSSIDEIVEQDHPTTDCESRLHTRRTQRYLKWRYAACPAVQYHGARHGNCSFVLRSRLRKGRAEVAIEELFSNGASTTDAISALWSFVGNSPADYLTAVAAIRTREAAVLAGAGFVPIPGIGPHLVARFFPRASTDPRSWKNWRPTLGDLELF